MNKDIYKWLKENLSNERYMHSLGTEKVARELAQRFGADPEKAAFAGLIHDIAKCLTNDELIKIINDNNILVSASELKSYKTLHAPVGAYIAKQKFKINDEEILNSIRFHTIGRVNMSLLEKIVFIADKIEENTRDKEFIDKIKKILDQTENIDEALLLCYNSTIKSLLDRRLFINTQTIDVYNYLLEEVSN